MDNKYDIVVIGGGSAGYSAALEAKRYGMSVLLIEKSNIGGCCLNKGCIPMKTLLSAATEYEAVKTKKWKSIEIPELGFSWENFKNECTEKISEMQEQIKSLIYSSEIEYVEADVMKIIYSENVYEVYFSNQLQKKLSTYTDNVIIATGAKPYQIKELSGSRKIIFVDDFWKLDSIPNSVIIVGGGSSGCELAYALKVFGVDVTIVESQTEILSGFNKKQVQPLKKKLQKSGVRLILGQQIIGIKDKENIQCVLSNGEKAEAEKVVIAAGRTSAIDTDIIKQLNLELSKKGFIKADSKGWTGKKGIYCVGDANGQNMLAHFAKMQAEAVVAEISGKQYKMSYIPKCVYTNPQIASIGKSIEEYEDKSNIRQGKCRYECLGMALAAHETQGKIMILRDINTDCIVGAQITGAQACELIHIVQGYMEENIPCKNIIRYIFAHPSLSEGIREAIIDSYKGE